MRIKDDDLPELSIGDASSITEGQASRTGFPVTASFAPNGIIPIRYRITEPGTGYNFIAGTGIRTARLNFGPNTQRNLLISIINDHRFDEDGIVRVTLLPD